MNTTPDHPDFTALALGEHIHGNPARAVLDAPTAHVGKTYDLTGPASISFHDTARTLTTLLGREIRYVPVPTASVVNAMKRLGHGWFAEVMGEYSEAYRANWGDFTTKDVELLTGHKPRSFETYAREVLLPALDPSTPK